ncbi:choice-of-anchor L domain-containing protein, partial [Winogradskyella sp. 3972H.M.0a.05]|uniref:choice-of-anchor L domain-containing protein n=1 Tax=Winogradskyella sp. 3972H.M.0a.05 TaxID=2950277 RepID=UPI003399BDB9
MKKIYSLLILLFPLVIFSQDLNMQDGTFNRCAPDIFYDSGGAAGNYGSDENFVTTICPQNANEFIILNFTEFSTQLNQDVLTIYDGDDTTAPVIGSYSGVAGPGNVQASSASGCLTIEFTSNATGTTTGWAAEILCATPCQTITPTIDSTTPAAEGGVVSILPGETVDFEGSATFSEDGTGATYQWNFGDTNTATGQSVSNTYTTPGTYTVFLAVTDTNPQGCTALTSITVFVLGPNVIIDQDTYTPEELIEDVLINSPCAQVSNINWSTGISFSSAEPNGIGFFYGNGIDFPFESGVILTSGDASEARGPNNNAMSAGGFGWPGDAELDATVGINSNNASFIEFDFVPLADNISFDFLMASEEYNGATGGTFECTFSDAFAFLLTDSMGNTTNLAVLPGTNTPILVTNIHPANPGCAAINEQYFGGYTAQNQPPTSFDGRTVVFTAQSPVTPGENYNIKLVIADASDTALDSGVFLKAGSFDLGGDLGDDITIMAGTAECDGTPILLNTGVVGAVHTWYKDGVEITGETDESLVVTEEGTYSVDIVFSGTCQASDEIFIEFKPSPVANPALDQSICNISGTGSFTLTDNDSEVLGGQDPADFIISYHLTEQDAIDNVNPLASPYDNVSNPQTIYVRIAELSQECFATTSFELTISSLSIPAVLTPLEECDDAVADGFTAFTLSDADAEVLGTQDPADYTVTYHETQADADANLNPLADGYVNTINPQVVYVRLETNNDTDCYNTTPLTLVVNPNPVATAPTPIALCDDDSDGFVEFDLSLRDLEVIGA